jgi:hypothetical protein
MTERARCGASNVAPRLENPDKATPRPSVTAEHCPYWSCIGALKHANAQLKNDPFMRGRLTPKPNFADGASLEPERDLEANNLIVAGGVSALPL